jgi:SAM-dependent methyltransferase
MPSLWQLVSAAIPADSSSQTSPFTLIEEEMRRPDAPHLVLDLGCGDAKSAGHFRAAKPDVEWVGLDIAESELARKVRDEAVVLYDGVHMPFASGSIPLVYSQQVFEHVRYPELVLAEIARVLAPGGVFLGSTSHLEPYHEYSLWNYTPYGFKVLVEAAGLQLRELRPGIDGVALITRTVEGRRPEHRRWWSGESPLNAEIERRAEKEGASHAKVNNRKLGVCGQFCFRVYKPHDWRPPRQRSTSWRDIRQQSRHVAEDARRLLAERLRETSRNLGLRDAARKVPGAQHAVRAVREQRAAQGRRG